MVIQLSSPLYCETMRERSTHCNRPTRVAILNTTEGLGYDGYTVQPICSHCIQALATAAGQASAPANEAIEAATIKQVLAARLGLEGAEEVLCEMRASAEDDGDQALADE